MGLLTALLAAGSAHAAFPGQNGKIAFVRFIGDEEIYSMESDGSLETPLTNSFGADAFPVWSADGTKIAFSSRRDGNFEIYVMNGDGSNQTRLTTNPARDDAPTWSPDGSKIAFQSTRDDPNPGCSPCRTEIYVMNADGSGETRLTTGSGHYPDWSPDGSRIAFRSKPDVFSTEEIYVMNADGTQRTRLTTTNAFEDWPTWSPDGARIAFVSDRDDPLGPREIYTMNSDGTDQTRVTFDGGDYAYPAWSPDGSKLLTSKERDGSLHEIYVMNADGTNLTPITNNNLSDAAPDWQPLVGSSPPPPYPAPKLAGSVRAPLVPIFRQCGTGGNPVNASHSPPVAVGSCSPPVPGSLAHFGPQSVGFAQLAVIYGDTNPANGDQANVTIRSSLSDVQTAAGADNDPDPSGADATLITRLRFTDRANGGSGTDPGTATDLDFSVPVVCTATSDPAVGSSCELDTTADAVLAGMIKENEATVLQTFRFRLNDAGANGVRGDGDDRIFATQGVFAP